MRAFTQRVGENAGALRRARIRCGAAGRCGAHQGRSCGVVLIIFVKLDNVCCTIVIMPVSSVSQSFTALCQFLLKYLLVCN